MLRNLEEVHIHSQLYQESATNVNVFCFALIDREGCLLGMTLVILLALFDPLLTCGHLLHIHHPLGEAEQHVLHNVENRSLLSDCV